MGAPIKLLPDAAYLRQCFSYDVGTGELRWKPRPREHMPNADLRCWASWNGKHAGKSAGTMIDGRPHVCLDYRYYWAHRIIWKMMTGDEPPDQIDHKDMDPSNNRWSNLRPATQAKQKWNQERLKNNTSGYRGVSFHRRSGKYQTRIQVHGVIRSLGYFDTAADAAAAADAARREAHGEFYR